MNITYTWKVKNIKTRDEVNEQGGTLPNAVIQTYWEKIGTDEDNKIGTFSGATPFTPTNVPDEEFIPFEELTEEIVLNWIKAVVVDSYETHVDEKILQQIMAAKQPIVEQNLPWVPQEESTPNIPETEE